MDGKDFLNFCAPSPSFKKNKMGNPLNGGLLDRHHQEDRLDSPGSAYRFIDKQPHQMQLPQVLRL